MTPLSPLFTDLYELTMAAGYFAQGIEAPATFSLYLRSQETRGYYVAAGLEAALNQLTDWVFTDSDLSYLAQSGLFNPAFLDYLRKMRFNVDVHALPEGSLFFADEPLLEVTAPMIQAQLLEPYLINTLGLATMIATKASRCVHAARGRGLIDFALRRTQGVDAGMTVARSTYLAGFDATSNVLAGQRYGIPVAGTMAHSFVLAFEQEIEAFRAYARLFPQRTILLIDTYDTLEGARKAVQVALEMQAAGNRLQGVRLDSGDLFALSRQVRGIFDDAGLPQVKIFASGGFDEYKLTEAVAQKAPIDAFGVGTIVGVSADAPYLDAVYKLVHYDGRDVRKLSTGKATLAGAKQVFRRFDDEGRFFREDIIGSRDEQIDDAAPLLQPVMQAGRRVGPAPELKEIRRDFRKAFKRLPEAYKQLAPALPYPVHLSKKLREIQDEVDRS